eukprot:687323-Prorocentrum_minimum.AAC.1
MLINNNIIIIADVGRVQFDGKKAPCDAHPSDLVWTPFGPPQAELSECEKALSDYLEAKRVAFPRLYFVSQADLMGILSHHADPARAMQHVSMVVPAIERVETTDSTPKSNLTGKNNSAGGVGATPATLALHSR